MCYWSSVGICSVVYVHVSQYIYCISYLCTFKIGLCSAEMLKIILKNFSSSSKIKSFWHISHEYLHFNLTTLTCGSYSRLLIKYKLRWSINRVYRKYCNNSIIETLQWWRRTFVFIQLRTSLERCCLNVNMKSQKSNLQWTLKINV